MLVALLLITFIATLFGRIIDVDASFATGLSIKNFLLALSLAAIFLSIATRRIPATLPLSVFGSLWFGCVIACLSIFLISVFSIYSGYSSVDAIISLKSKLVDPLLMLTIGYYSVQTPTAAIKLYRILTIVVVAGCVLTIIDVFNIPDLGLITAREKDGRIQGFIGSAEEFSTIVAATLPILILGTKWTSGFSKLFVYFSILVMITCLLLAATRAPIVALTGAWLLYALFVARDGPMSHLSVVAIFVPAIAVVLFFLSYTPYWGLITERFSTGLSSANVYQLSSGRSVIWGEIFAQMLKQPSSFIIGMGWDVYFQSAGHRFSTHNIIIDRFYSLGLFGLIAYLIAYWSALRFLFWSSPTNSGINYSLCTSAGFSLLVLLISAMFADLEVSEFFIYAFVGIGLRVASFTILDLDTLPGQSSSQGKPSPKISRDFGNASINRF